MAAIGTIQQTGKANNTVPQVEAATKALRATEKPHQIRASFAASKSFIFVNSATSGIGLSSAPMVGFRWTDPFTDAVIKGVSCGFGSASVDTAGVWTVQLFKATQYTKQYQDSGNPAAASEGVVVVQPSVLASRQPLRFESGAGGSTGGGATEPPDIVVPSAITNNTNGTYHLVGANLNLDLNALASVSISKVAVAGRQPGDGPNGAVSCYPPRCYSSDDFPLLDIYAGDFPLVLQNGEGFVLVLTTPVFTATNTTATMSFNILYDAVALTAAEL